jgi:anion-transporting  ArsA/GET3 family ATPase
MIDSLLSSRLIFVTGKGGVGKSTACAGLGRALALRGKRVLIVETDTYSAMADLFNVPLTGSHPVRVDERLRVVNLLAQDALVEIIQQFVPGEKIARGIIGNRIASVFFNAAPSVNEFVILNRIFKYYQETEAGRPAYDHIVVDLPASGHAVTFLNVPQTLHGMMRVGAFAQLAQDVGALIADPKRCAVVAVCLPEEMPVNETLELSTAITAQLKRPLTLVLLNMVHKPPFEQRHAEAFQAIQQGAAAHEAELAPPLIRLLAGTSLAQDWYARDQRYAQVLRDQLGRPIVELPMFYEEDGNRVVLRIAEQLAQRPADTLAS